ncbi:hypothetical protein HU200_066536 [Digitaria exilis]|uniref:DUF4220 domain-containing protein n=1 Tax=Digitaria exilis TaxID=1010633 RepID=A0A835DTW1_9POAL|nr:hypothetical protein HU200_066536 [Digitaria exilis]
MDLWNGWETQTLVLVSLGWQVVLLLLAGIRRQEGQRGRKVILWLVYQFADSTAIYTIGHLALTGAAEQRQLVAFWAPFLLLHLGGPDNITAYSLQDNELWLRHLQNLIIQILGVGYVLYNNIAGNNLILLAAILMSVVGVVKYAERTHALRCSNLDHIRSSRKDLIAKHHQFHVLDQKFDEEAGDEFYVRRAHSLFYVCKHAIVDSWIEKDPENRNSLEILQNLSKEDYRAVWTLMEVELSLMYDLLYTKAGVIHTWQGYCIRVLSPLAVSASLLLFQFGGKDGHREMDVTAIYVTYTLLVGALIIETGSLLTALGSSWTYAFLCATRWSWLRNVALCTGRWYRLRRFIQMITGSGGRNLSERRWSGKMDQYNLLHYCSRHDRTYIRLVGTFLQMLGFKEWWIGYYYSKTIDIPDYLKKKLFDYIHDGFGGDDIENIERSLNAQGLIRKKWGQETVLKEFREDDGTYKKEVEKTVNYLFGVEFQECIIVWHIGTDVFLNQSSGVVDATDAADLINAIRMLSNYLFFLLVDRPYMLPGLPQTSLYLRTRENLENMWNENSQSRDELATILYDKNPSYSDEVPRLSNAIRVTKLLRDLQKRKGSKLATLGVLLNLWMDILMHAANRCSRESHAKKLSDGGELITALWLMINYLHHGDYALKPKDV